MGNDILDYNLYRQVSVIYLDPAVTCKIDAQLHVFAFKSNRANGNV